MRLFFFRLIFILTAFSPTSLALAEEVSTVPESKSAFRNLTIEPYVGYGSGSLSTTAGPSASYTSGTLGFRFLFYFEDIFFVGPEFSFQPSLSYTLAGASDSLSPNPRGSKFGVVIGVLLPWRFRFWIGYNPVDTLDNFTLNTPGVLTTEGFGGTSFKFGLGYKVFPRLSLNLETFFTSYGNITGSSGPVSSTSSLSDDQVLSGSLFVFSASMPISF